MLRHAAQGRGNPPTAARIAVIGVIALMLVTLAWELLLAPLRPGGSFLALKALPLALLIPAASRGKRRALQWLALLLPFYLAEGIVRGWSESGRHATMAWLAAAASVLSRTREACVASTTTRC